MRWLTRLERPGEEVKRDALNVAGMDSALACTYLPEEEAHRLVIAAQEGDDAARNQLLESGYLLLAASIADACWQRTRDYCEFSDLFSEAVLALMELAVPRYNGRVPFKHWASICIRTRLHVYVRKQLVHARRTASLDSSRVVWDESRGEAWSTNLEHLMFVIPEEGRDAHMALLDATLSSAASQDVIRPRDREWILQAAAGSTQEEIAAGYGCTRENVAQQITKALEALRAWAS